MFDIIKRFQIILLPILFGFLGYVYNQSTKDNWNYRYEVKKSFPAIIYLNSIDEKMVRLKVSDTTHIKFKDAVGPIIVENQNFIRKKFPSLKELNISEKYINFRADNFEIAEKLIDEVVFELNTVIRAGISERLNIYTQNAIDLISNQKDIKKKELKRSIEFYKDKKVTPLSLSPKSGLTIDNYLLSEKNEDNKELIENLKAELIDYEYYNAVHKFELMLLELNSTDEKDNVNLLTVEDINKKLKNTNIMINIGLDGRFNTKPKLLTSILSFAVFGFFISLVTIFLVLNSRFLKELTLKKLLTLPHLK